jgi:hypothetical protein
LIKTISVTAELLVNLLTCPHSMIVSPGEN